MPVQQKEAHTQELCSAGMRLSTPSIDRSYFGIISKSKPCSSHRSHTRRSYYRTLSVEMSIQLSCHPCQRFLHSACCILSLRRLDALLEMDIFATKGTHGMLLSTCIPEKASNSKAGKDLSKRKFRMPDLMTSAHIVLHKYAALIMLVPGLSI